MCIQMVKVKIDGVRRVEDALTAAETGADFIGFVFVPNRRRCVSVEQARRMVDAVKTAVDNPPKLLGLFADQPLEEVKETVVRSGVDMVQMSGKESMEYCDDVPVPLFKAIHVPGGMVGDEVVGKVEKQLTMLRERGHLATLDRLVAGLQGGTGQSFDWSVAGQLSQAGFEFMLAGGLTPENVGRAVREVQPWGVDVSSGVETQGVQDAEKIRQFVAEARRAAQFFNRRKT